MLCTISRRTGNRHTIQCNLMYILVILVTNQTYSYIRYLPSRRQHAINQLYIYIFYSAHAQPAALPLAHCYSFALPVGSLVESTTACKRGSRPSYLSPTLLSSSTVIQLQKFDTICFEMVVLELEPETFDPKASQPLATS